MGFNTLRNCQLLVHHVPWNLEIACMLVVRKPGLEGAERYSYVSNVEFTDVEPGGILPEIDPTFTLPRHHAQALMDELWQCGLRPSEGTGSAGSLRAVEKHLDDMRAIVGKQLDVSLGGGKR